MVELQSHARDFADAGVALYALSYDEVDALETFGTDHGIGFPLLSDPDSAIITRFGILNTLIDPDDHPWHGIPFPGTYVTDAAGVITAKFFENSLFFRASADTLLRAALGEEVEPPRRDPVGEVTADVTFAGDVLHAGVLRDLAVRFAVPDGQHLYGEPTPPGLVATSVEIDDQPGVIARPPQLPATSPMTLAGSGETVQIFDGDVEIRLPITHIGRSLVTLDDGSQVLRLTGTLRWQACDDDACGLPQTQTFAIDIPARPHNWPGADSRAHMARLLSRRSDRDLGEMFSAITGPDA